MISRCCQISWILAILALELQIIALGMFCKPSNSQKRDNSFKTVSSALLSQVLFRKNHEDLIMNMYACSAAHPQNEIYSGNSAFITSHSKQMFVINDGVEGSFNPPMGSLPYIVSRSLAWEIVRAFDRRIDWRQAMLMAIMNLHRRDVDGTTSSLVVRKLWLNGRNVVEVYSLGDARAVLLRREKNRKTYTIEKVTEKQFDREPNKPFQIAGKKSSLYAGYSVEHMTETRFDVENGDLVIAASDTLWKVISTEDIAAIAHSMSSRKLAKFLTQIVRAANVHGDITVVVGRIVSNDDQLSFSDRHNCDCIDVEWRTAQQPNDCPNKLIRVLNSIQI